MNGRERLSRSPGGALSRQWPHGGRNGRKRTVRGRSAELNLVFRKRGSFKLDWLWNRGNGRIQGGVLDEAETFSFILEVGIGEKNAIRGFLMG